MKIETGSELREALEVIRSAASRLSTASTESKISKHGVAQSELDCAQLRQKMLPDTWQPLTAWFVVIELYLAFRVGRVASVKHVMLAAGAPSATVSRHVKQLCDGGWVQKSASWTDRRVSNLVLTKPAVDLVENWLDARSRQLFRIE